MSASNMGGEPGVTPSAQNEPRSSDRSPSEMANKATQTVKQEAASFAAEAKDKALEKVGAQTETAGQTLGDFANAVRKAGDELSQADQSMAGRVVRQAADGLEGLARSISGRRPEELLDAVRDFGRRNPTAFLAGSVLTGLALGRFLKSSGEGAGGLDDPAGAQSLWAADLPQAEPAIPPPTAAPDAYAAQDLAAETDGQGQAQAQRQGLGPQAPGSEV